MKILLEFPELDAEFEKDQHVQAEKQDENAGHDMLFKAQHDEEIGQNGAKKGHQKRDHAPFENALHHVQPGSVIAEYGFLALQFGGGLLEIAVAHIALHIFPNAVAEHLHIFFFVGFSFLIVAQLIDDVLRLASFKVVQAQRIDLDELQLF